MSSAISRTFGMNSASGHTWLTMPNSSASRAVMIRPVISSSLALATPIMRGTVNRLRASGTTPRRTNTNPIRALSAATRMSHCIGSVIPIPTAGPLIAAMIGLRTFHGRIARAERATGPGDDDHTHVVVLVVLGERSVEVRGHRSRERVQFLRPIQRDRRDAVFDFLQNMSAGHIGLLL